MSVIFCKTRYQDHGYHSYQDFWTLVDLAGFPVIYVDQIDPASDNTYIVTPLNGEWLHGWQQPRARIIHWELEWRTDWRAEANTPPGVADVWASDYRYALEISANYVCLGSDPLLNLDPVSQTTKIYDVVLLQYLTYRRQVVRDQLVRAGLRIAPDGWGWERHASLSKSKAMLHVHQHDNVRTIAPLRWCLAAAYKLPVISEAVEQGFPNPSAIYAPYADLAAATWRALQSDKLSASGAMLFDDLCVNRTFRKCVEEAL